MSEEKAVFDERCKEIAHGKGTIGEKAKALFLMQLERCLDVGRDIDPDIVTVASAAAAASAVMRVFALDAAAKAGLDANYVEKVTANVISKAVSGGYEM